MHLLYPNSPLRSRQPDEQFEAEVDAVRNAGFEVSLISLEDFQAGRFHAVPALPGSTDILYRGWMLSAEENAALVAAIAGAGSTPFTDIHKPEQVSAVVADMKCYRGVIEGGFCVRRVEAFLPHTERRYFVVDGVPHALWRLDSQTNAVLPVLLAALQDNSIHRAGAKRFAAEALAEMGLPRAVRCRCSKRCSQTSKRACGNPQPKR